MSEPSLEQIGAPPACYRHPKVAAGVTCQRCNNQICSKCMNTASVGFHCPDCVKKHSQRVVPAGAAIRKAQDFPATKVIIGINVAVFVLLDLVGGSPGSELAQLKNDGLLYGPAVGDGEWWRLFSKGFLHANLIHLGMNMYVLFSLGRILEPILGMRNYLITYVGSLFAGSVGVLLLSPTSPTLGASGAVFGLFGAMAMLVVAQRRNLMSSGVMGPIAINLVFTFSIPGVSIGGHIGGLIGGVLFGAIFFEGRRRLRLNMGNAGGSLSQADGIENVLAIVGVVATIALFFMGVVIAP